MTHRPCEDKQLVNKFPSFVEHEAHHRIRKSLPLNPVLSQMDPVQVLKSRDFNIYCNANSYLSSDLVNGLFLPSSVLICHMHATCPVRLVPIHLNTLWYLARSINYEVVYFIIFSATLPLCQSELLIMSLNKKTQFTVLSQPLS
jgi:hypothetical protein